jgi:hypothetical protein
MGALVTKKLEPNLKEFPPNSLVLKIPTEIPTNQYQYEIKASPETGHFLQPITLHTPNEV